MIFFRNTTDFDAGADSVVTLGKFDGLHRGHQLLIREVLRIGRDEGLKTVVFTFGVHPRAQVAGKPQELLLTNEEKRERLEAQGIDMEVEFPFNDITSHMQPRDFVREILAGKLRAKKVIVGTDFGFGYKRAGNVALLQEMSAECGFEVIVKKKLKTKEGLDISSSYIKDLLRLGHMEQVNGLLGYPFSIRGPVVQGNHYGRTFGMPTINQVPPPEKLMPPNGVYVSRTLIDGVSYKSVTNIGVKPTIDGKYPKGAETHIHDFERDVYGQTVQVQLYSYARPEMKFESKEQLIAQMRRDSRSALDFWEDESHWIGTQSGR